MRQGLEIFKDADLALGEKLIKERGCDQCHAARVGGDGSAIYRPKGCINTPAALRTMVEYCNTQGNISSSPTRSRRSRRRCSATTTTSSERNPARPDPALRYSLKRSRVACAHSPITASARRTVGTPSTNGSGFIPPCRRSCSSLANEPS